MKLKHRNLFGCMCLFASVSLFSCGETASSDYHPGRGDSAVDGNSVLDVGYYDRLVEEACKGVVCGDNEKCVDGGCVPQPSDVDTGKYLCGETTCAGDEICIDDTCYKIDDSACTPACTLPKVCVNGSCKEVPTTKVSKIELDQEELDVLRVETVGITATITPKYASNQKIVWTMKNVTEGHSEDPSKIVDSFCAPGDSDCKQYRIKGISHGARKLELTATNPDSGIKAKATIHVKPYLSLALPMDELYKVKDFYTAGQYRPNKPSSPGMLECRYFSNVSIKTFHDDLYKKYVRPAIYQDSKGKLFGTRASVVAAARFLVLQFPYDIPYYGDGTKGKPTIKDSDTTWSHFAWSTQEKVDGDGSAARIVGLNLSKQISNSVGKILRHDLIAWGCEIPNGHVGQDGWKALNGLECSGFVAWAFRNGRIHLGDWTTHIFAKHGKCKKEGKVVRNFRCSDYINALGESSNGRVSNPNNYHDSTWSKLNQLSDSDYNKLRTLKENEIKAGDILWQACYKSRQSGCFDITPKVDFKGHIAMILGIERDTSDSSKIRKVHIGEAAADAGNKLTTMTWDEFRSKWYTTRSGEKKENRWVAYEDKPSRCECESVLIRMDKVYNFKQTKGYVASDAPSGVLNKHKYTDFWQ